MIQLSNLTKSFGDRVLLDDVTWQITDRERVGLCGPNGAGKTTLLRMMAALDEPDSGAILKPGALTVGYLPQDGLSHAGRTVFEEASSAFDALLAMKTEMHALEARLGDPSIPESEHEAMLGRYSDLQDGFRHGEGYTVELKTATVLQGLGFKPSDFDRFTDTFSGGWQMRIALAKLLLGQPNLLLLDEPTNHLDLEARNWLETYLADYPHAYVLISHDRYFLDVTVNRTVEIWNKKVHFYSGNYESYLRQKEERRAQLEAAYRNQRERIEQLEAFINRFRYQATKAKQVQSRIKELEKIERIEIPPDEQTIHFSFPQPKPSGRIVAEFKDVAKNYGAKHVFGGASFIIERVDRIALVGINGAGKSTLIKLLAGIEPLIQGSFTLGHNAIPDYFAQDQYKELNPDRRLLDDLSDAAPRATQTELRTLLGCFLFSDDDVFKRIGVLSGGERNRYALARMLLAPSNFLLLDEPTNHLDMRAKDVLLESLRRYTGTVVFVSHDRYFIDKLATRIFEIGGGEIHDYPGNYEDYLWQREGRAPRSDGPESETVVAASAGGNGKLKEPEARAKKLHPLLLRQMQERGQELEEEIARAEAEVAACELGFGNFKSAEESIRLSRRIDELRRALSEMMREWEQIARALDEPGKASLSRG